MLSRCDQEHYDQESRSFTRSFVVGTLGDCCAASAGLAKGISFDTFSKSRADVTKGRPLHIGRVELRSKQQSKERAHLHAYIRHVRSQMEGPKGGSEPKDKWRLPKKPLAKRWEDYMNHRKGARLPVIGSQSLFEQLWREHDEIVEFGAKGHPKCDTCGELLADREKYAGRPDKLAETERKQVCPRPPPDCAPPLTPSGGGGVAEGWRRGGGSPPHGHRMSSRAYAPAHRHLIGTARPQSSWRASLP